MNWLRQSVLKLLKLPAQPAAPFGAPGSIRVFRAGRNYYRLALFRWGIRQLAGVIGILISLAFLAGVKRGLESHLPGGEPASQQGFFNPWEGMMRDMQDSPQAKELAGKLAPHASVVFPILYLVETFAIAAFLVQLVLTGMVQRLDYELRWYVVTDRSLRIRSGIWNVQETTMSFANVQQVTLSQGPLQRLFGLSDLHVRSAGGGGGSEHQKETLGDSMHVGVFSGIAEATAVRDLVLARLRAFRDAGLGDTDDAPVHVSPAKEVVPSGASGDVGDASRELLVEARALRRWVESL